LEQSHKTQAANESQLMKTSPDPRRMLLFAAIIGLAAASVRAADPRTVLFFGDSLTAGYGLEDPSTQAFPALIQKKIDQAGRPWRVVNAGLSGETSAGGLRRVDWILRQPVDVFVLELGGNDGLRGIPPAATEANLQAIIDRVRAKYPAARIVLAGMAAPPNMGPDFTRTFAAIFPALAEKNPVLLIPFLLEGVAGWPELNQPDGIHPTVRGHALVGETVWSVLKSLL
jgi:acyl-CoA thioesterase-1